VRNPASEKQDRRGLRQVGWIEVLGAGVKEVAHVIEGHNDHYKPAENIDRLDSGPRA
jgi:hypothetical protein